MSGEDILVEFPPTRYLEYNDGRYTFCLYADEWGSGELGNNFLSGHDILFDIENERIGFAESNCVPPDDLCKLYSSTKVILLGIIYSRTFVIY